MILLYVLKWDISKLEDHIHFLQSGQHLHVGAVKTSMWTCNCQECMNVKTYNLSYSMSTKQSSESNCPWKQPLTAFYGKVPLYIEVECEDDVKPDLDLPLSTELELPRWYLLTPPLDLNVPLVDAVDTLPSPLSCKVNKNKLHHRTPIILPAALTSFKISIKIYCSQALTRFGVEQYSTNYY